MISIVLPLSTFMARLMWTYLEGKGGGDFPTATNHHLYHLWKYWQLWFDLICHCFPILGMKYINDIWLGLKKNIVEWFYDLSPSEAWMSIYLTSSSWFELLPSCQMSALQRMLILRSLYFSGPYWSINPQLHVFEGWNRQLYMGMGMEIRFKKKKEVKYFY